MSEELNRKYHELCGWRVERNPAARPRGFHGLSEWWVDELNGHTSPRLPALHLDANLAIAEADRVFSHHWSVDRLGNKFAAWSKETLISAEGATFCEAILKALIAAKEASQ